MGMRKVFETMVTRKNDEAVSPVIGVILMVAITVILAAVIAAFVFGMSGNIAKTKNVAATAQVVGTNTVVTYQGGADHLALDNGATPLVATFTDATGATIDATTPFGLTVNVGDSAVAEHTAGGVKDHVVVTARFTDGSQQVILDTQL
jgi:flagellin-like protein